MKVIDEKGKLTFLYELAQGRSSKSFGIQVAELAGNGSGDTSQLSLFGTLAEPLRAPEVSEEIVSEKTIEPEHPALTELRSLDLNSMTPIEVMNWLNHLKSGMDSAVISYKK